MSRIDVMASWFLGQLGAALLLISILLVPQNRVLAVSPDYTAGTCQGNLTCGTYNCEVYWQLNDSTCPGTCENKSGTIKYCKCAADADQCADCVCAQTFGQSDCGCRNP